MLKRNYLPWKRLPTGLPGVIRITGAESSLGQITGIVMYQETIPLDTFIRSCATLLVA